MIRANLGVDVLSSSALLAKPHRKDVVMPEGLVLPTGERYSPVQECPQLVIVVLHCCACKAVPQRRLDGAGSSVESVPAILQPMCLIHNHHMPVHFLEVLNV